VHWNVTCGASAEWTALATLKSYFAYCHRARTHLSLGKDAPDPRPVQLTSAHEIVAFPEVGGLHHRYERSRVSTDAETPE